MPWFAIAGLAISAAGTAASVSSQRKATKAADARQRELLKQFSSDKPYGPYDAENFEVPLSEVNVDALLSRPERVSFDEVDAFKEAERALRYNVDRAIPTLIPAAEEITQKNAESVKSAIGQFFPSFEESLDNLSRNIRDRQQGRLSLGTRRQLSRSLLGSGVTELGSGAVADNLTGYLGLTAEQVSQLGDQQALSAASTFRQLFNAVSATDLLGFGGVSSGQAIQSAFQNSYGNLQASQFNVQALQQYEQFRASAIIQQEQFNAAQQFNGLQFLENVRQFGVQTNLSAAGLGFQNQSNVAAQTAAVNQQAIGNLTSDAVGTLGYFAGQPNNQASAGSPANNNSIFLDGRDVAQPYARVTPASGGGGGGGFTTSAASTALPQGSSAASSQLFPSGSVSFLGAS